ncbi:MAG: hypothetical protein A3G18_04995 [Rhodospirillales bacterium RIFCSPLOWO2_12_FULL_58_28]|nr:MAG: hypothetical protein A3H92_03845 [Rhodospirillales bacterium RIFCSPLOWO2_02_FULL_58_16]OHC78270.1 MAG: hypothetical protein A3G18_04995 [Rhodospirillales bacterium RIFCSPLOWO2_12_FULL_58_28]
MTKKASFITAIIACLPLTPALSANLDTHSKEGVDIIKKFSDTLKGELQSAMKSGGPINAVGVCNIKMPELTSSASSGAWTVSRTSLKLRNPKNKPDTWELKTLKMFEEKKAEGTPADKLAYAEVLDVDGKKVFRIMKAIPTGEVCMNCHGPALNPEVSKKLYELYPDDKARGFNIDDIRGAFSLKKQL